MGSILGRIRAIPSPERHWKDPHEAVLPPHRVSSSSLRRNSLRGIPDPSLSTYAPRDRVGPSDTIVWMEWGKGQEMGADCGLSIKW